MNKPLALSNLIKIILVIVSLSILYFYYRWHKRKKNKEAIINLLPEIQRATSDFAPHFSGEKYFAYYDYTKLETAHQYLLAQIPTDYRNYNLNEQEYHTVDHFYTIHHDQQQVRKTYNSEYTQKETRNFSPFFSTLEKYPLSEEQMLAVVSEEDNNLVIAGAGTGKTTTISAKIAYLLKKSMANPEDLLVISFTNAAVEEMFERTLKFCGKSAGIDRITFKTFNSFGNQVIRHCNPTPKQIAFEGKDYKAKAFLQETFDKLFKTDDDFQNKAINFLVFFNRPVKDEFEFNSAEEYRIHQESQRCISLDGTEVKSNEELQIANFLFLHQVSFKYETLFPLEREDRNPEFGNYAPDFYLPGHNIYHEHYGIDENGDVPSWFAKRPPFETAKDYYHHGMNWKESIHKKYNTKLIKTYSFQSRKGSMLSSLKSQLISFGVTLNKRNPDEIISRLKKTENFDGFMNLIYTFLMLMKSSGMLPNNLKNESTTRRFSVFLDVFTPLYLAYQQKLKQTNTIDFNDMVNHASHYIKTGKYQKTYKYILVDEFQDMSQGRFAMLDALKKANPAAKLYAVGDDWQSVYRFNGSDVSIITKFRDYFGATAVNQILQTYRFNTEILEVSSSFIQKNPSQLRKKLSSPIDSTLPAFKLIPMYYGRMKKAEADLYRLEAIDQVLKEISNNKDINHKTQTNIFIIGRYQHNRPTDLSLLQKKYPNLRLSFYTAHGSKGLTCDYVILLNLDSGIFGFPSEVADDAVLDQLLQDSGSYENAEERRLFYVAITRARHKNFLMYNQSSPSKFITELKADYEMEN
ncbi:UvrD-helicase domain-containing protein [Pedobacter agri]|uniref:UvrD-helicase domain-containing protein n=1 Tax=Pedobacter agri TaxID=454586 RepID=UPI0029303204|nr:UvrD-helicase domain-containing protein [Pedobacter agri]